jgi:hypothetical protein
MLAFAMMWVTNMKLSSRTALVLAISLLGIACLDKEEDVTDKGVCIGPELSQEAWNAKPGPIIEVEEAAVDGEDGDGAADTGEAAVDGDGAADTGEAAVDGEADTGEDDAGAQSDVTTIGEAAPVFALTDFQPQSCGFGATYGLEAFKGKVTVVVLLAAW